MCQLKFDIFSYNISVIFQIFTMINIFSMAIIVLSIKRSRMQIIGLQWMENATKLSNSEVSEIGKLFSLNKIHILLLLCILFVSLLYYRILCGGTYEEHHCCLCFGSKRQLCCKRPAQCSYTEAMFKSMRGYEFG